MLSQLSRILSSFLCLFDLRLALHSSTGIVQTQATNAAPLVRVPTKEKFDSSAVIPTLEKQDAEKNPYGIRTMWEQGNFVARKTLLIMLIMSSWYTGMRIFFEQGKLINKTSNVHENFSNTVTLRQSTDQLKVENSFVFTTKKALEGVMTLGVHNALLSIFLTGKDSVGKVVGPVDEFPIMTANGLAVAVPNVLRYHWLAHRNKLALEPVQFFGYDQHVVMLQTAGT